MPGHSRLKDGVLPHAYVPGIHVFTSVQQDADGRDKPGHDSNRTARATSDAAYRSRSANNTMVLR